MNHSEVLKQGYDSSVSLKDVIYLNSYTHTHTLTEKNKKKWWLELLSLRFTQNRQIGVAGGRLD